ncbi:MAG: isoprenyl transferase [Alphaproteobacteria bacterium]
MRALPSHSDSLPPPVHVAIIMDGNGRWAQARGLPRTEGHRQGAEAVRRTVNCAGNLGISYLTLYGFSSENWKRSAAEIGDLMGLLRLYLRSEIAELHKNGIRLKVIGNRERLDPDIVALIEDAERRTEGNTALNLTVALSYGSRSEIAMAARRLAEQAVAARLDPADIDMEMFARHLETVGMPDPDLVIRTSGEKRLSNFLLWQSAYAELVFVDTLWPDFDERDLENAIQEFHRRERRYGTASG